jgi:catechol 2,3-dioxygenase-like lactoylglutathione lyase family enzyme
MATPPRVRRTLETALYCADLTKTAAFYQQLFNVTPMLSGDRLVALDTGEQTVLLLFQKGNSGPLETSGGLVPGHDGSGPVHVAFAIDTAEVPAWESRLSALRIAVESRVRWGRGGTSIYFRDPDNRSVELATPGIWPSY